MTKYMRTCTDIDTLQSGQFCLGKRCFRPWSLDAKANSMKQEFSRPLVDIYRCTSCVVLAWRGFVELEVSVCSSFSLLMYSLRGRFNSSADKSLLFPNGETLKAILITRTPKMLMMLSPIISAISFELSCPGRRVNSVCLEVKGPCATSYCYVC